MGDFGITWNPDNLDCAETREKMVLVREAGEPAGFSAPPAAYAAGAPTPPCFHETIWICRAALDSRFHSGTRAPSEEGGQPCIHRNDAVVFLASEVTDMAASARSPWQRLGTYVSLALVVPVVSLVSAQSPETLPVPARMSVGEAPVPINVPALGPTDRPLPINLPTALKLANVRPLDIALASARIRQAAAELDRTRVLWLPTILYGADYFRHDGTLQKAEGNLIDNSHGSFMIGAGPSAIFAISDAIFAPLAQRQVVLSREAALQTAQNDSLLAVAEAYFNVEQATGELAGAVEATRRSEDLVRRMDKLAPGLIPPVETVRARVELSHRVQAARVAREHWHTASTDLQRILRLDPLVIVQPLEPPHLQVTLVALDRPVEDLIAVGLQNRPELAGQKALVEAAIQQLRAERWRPFIPMVQVRGASTNPTGTLAGGVFGGGIDGSLSNFNGRLDIDVQVLWQLENLGFGNRARIKGREAENQGALLELYRTQDRVAADVARAFELARSAWDRMHEAENEVKLATESADKNLEGLGQTKQAGNLVLLIIRPLEALASVQVLAQAYNDYYGAVADYNRAQFRLYWAIGQPAQHLGETDSIAPPYCAPPVVEIPKVEVAPNASPVLPGIGKP
jgi:outer membrane protein TolC